MKAHIGVIQAINNGEQVDTLYYGQDILAYIMKPFADSENLETIYLWFSFIILIVCAVVLYYVTNKLVNGTAAILVIPITFCCSVGIFALFKFGVIFNIINMCIVLPLAVLFSVRWFAGKGEWNALLGLLSFTLFSIFHVTSLYLPYVVGVALVVYVGYALKKHKVVSLKRAIPYGFVLALMNILVADQFIGGVSKIQTTSAFVGEGTSHIVNLMAATPASLVIIMEFLSFTIILTVLAIAGFIALRKKTIVDSQKKILLYIFGSFILALGFGLILMSMPQLSQMSIDILWFHRIALDLATIIAMATACVLGFVMQHNRFKIFNIVVVFSVIGGSIPTLIAWVA